MGGEVVVDQVTGVRGPPVQASRVPGHAQLGGGADTRPPNNNVVLETPGLHHGVQVGVVVGGAGVIGVVAGGGGRGGHHVVLGGRGRGAPGVGQPQGRARPAQLQPRLHVEGRVRVWQRGGGGGGGVQHEGRQARLLRLRAAARAALRGGVRAGAHPELHPRPRTRVPRHTRTWGLTLCRYIVGGCGGGASLQPVGAPLHLEIVLTRDVSTVIVSRPATLRHHPRLGIHAVTLGFRVPAHVVAVATGRHIIAHTFDPLLFFPLVLRILDVGNVRGRPGEEGPGGSHTVQRVATALFLHVFQGGFERPDNP